MSDLFSKAMGEVISRVRLTQPEAELLKRFRASGGTYSAFAEVIADDPELEGNILQIANKAVEGKVEEPITSAAAALSFLGFLPTRNFIAASIVGDRASLAPGSPQVADAIKFALLCEQQVKEGQPIATDFFVAGLVFDSLRKIARSGVLAIPPEIAEKRLMDLWTHSRSVALTAVQLSQKLMPELALEHDLAMDGWLHDIGRAVFALLAPETEPPYEPAESGAGLESEKNRWEFGHPAYGHLLLSRFRVLKETSWVVLFHHEPFLAKKLGKLAYARAMILWLAERLVAYRDLHGNTKFDEQTVLRWNAALQPAVKARPDAFSQAVTQISL